MLDPKSVHWQFAAGNAFSALESQIRRFDFELCANGHSYAGLNPHEFVQIIDGFLSEDTEVVPSGNRSALRELRQFLVENVIQAYDAGSKSGTTTWKASDQEYCSIGLQELQAKARKISPFSDVEAEWFVEGFCRAYTRSELESLK